MRRRILLLVTGVTTLVVLAFAVPLAVVAKYAVRDRAVRETADEAGGIALFLQTGAPSREEIQDYLSSLNAGGRREATVLLPDGTALGASIPGPDVDRPPPGGGFDPDRGGGYGRGLQQAQVHAIAGGQVAEVPVAAAGATYFVRVFVTADQLGDGVRTWWLLITGASVGLIALGAAGSELLSRRLVRPLERTADTAHRLSAGDVTARAPTDGPREVAEVGAALNRLADRIEQLIADERETVADLSHRLRTPLTALRLDAESLADPEDAERIGTHVSALERTLTAVIRAARRPQREGLVAATDAAGVVADRVRFWSALTEEQDRECALTVPDGPLPVRASGDDLAAAVDALIENVVAHTPEGTRFAVRLVAAPPGAVLEVADAGPGLPPDAPIRGRSDRGSTGLGLDIARRCAEASGGVMETGRSDLGGALVRLVLGAP